MPGTFAKFCLKYSALQLEHMQMCPRPSMATAEASKRTTHFSEGGRPVRGTTCQFPRTCAQSGADPTQTEQVSKLEIGQLAHLYLARPLHGANLRVLREIEAELYTKAAELCTQAAL